MPMWTPFAHQPAAQPSRVQPVQARPSSNPSIFSAPSLFFVVSCRAPAAAGRRAGLSTSSPRCRCRVRSCMLLLVLLSLLAARLVRDPAVLLGSAPAAQPHHHKHMIADWDVDSAHVTHHNRCRH